jgi:S-adenosyl methyltransferase
MPTLVGHCVEAPDHLRGWRTMRDESRIGETVAGVYNALLRKDGGGEYSLTDEQRLRDQVVAACPDAPDLADSASVVMPQAVRKAFTTQTPTRPPIKQVLDLGCGPPPPNGMVHEVAQSIVPDARTAYVDISSRAIGHIFERLGNAGPHTTAVEADITDVDSVLTHPDITATLNFGQPMLVLLGLVTQLVLDDSTLTTILRRYRDATAPGSLMVITAPCSDSSLHQQMRDVVDIYRKAKPPVFWKLRSLEALKRVLPAHEAWTPPGLVPAWELYPGVEPAIRLSPEQARRRGHAMVAVEIGRP